MILPLLYFGPNELTGLLHLATDLRTERSRLPIFSPSLAPSREQTAAGAPLQRATTVTNCAFICLDNPLIQPLIVLCSVSNRKSVSNLIWKRGSEYTQLLQLCDFWINSNKTFKHIHTSCVSIAVFFCKIKVIFQRFRIYNCDLKVFLSNGTKFFSLII